MNKVDDFNTSIEYISINGKRFGLFSKVIDYRGKNFDKPVRRFFIECANDFNISGVFQIEAPTIKGLIKKIEAHPYRLVR